MNQQNRSDYLIKGFWNTCKTYLFFLFIFTCFRIFFLYFFGDKSIFSTHLNEIGYAFFLGWKYDTLVISFILTPIVMIHFFLSIIGSHFLINFSISIYRFYLFVVSLICVGLLISDMGFYLYFQDHINILFYGILEDDTKALFETMFKNYPAVEILIGFSIFTLFSFWFIRFLNPKFELKRSTFNPGAGKFLFVSIICFTLLIGGLRGGYSKVVIAPKYSDFSENEFVNQISINGIVTLENAMRLRKERAGGDQKFAKILGYGNDKNKAFSDYLGLDVSNNNEAELISLLKRKTDINEKLKQEPLNIVVIIMESFGGDWIKYNTNDFNFLAGLEKHFKEDFYFKNILSADNGTIGSLMTLVTNIPHRPGARFLSESKYMQLPLESGSHIPFKKNNYETSFYYGGKLGWRDLGKYLRFQNIDHVIGEGSIVKELKLKEDIGTEWGTFDEHLFKSIENKLLKNDKPQFVMALSTTNHPPFEVPKKFKSQLSNEIPKTLKDKMRRDSDVFKKRFKAFEYTNYALSQFISNIKNSRLKENTIIAITGDHNFWGFVHYKTKENFTKHTVPLYFYIPENLKPKDYNANLLGSHKDIMTTLYHLALSDTEYLSFGNNLFNTEEGVAFNAKLYANKNALVYKNKNYDWGSDFELNPEVKKLKNIKLDLKYRSTLSVADFFLNYSLKTNN